MTRYTILIHRNIPRSIKVDQATKLSKNWIIDILQRLRDYSGLPPKVNKFLVKIGENPLLHFFKFNR